MGGAEAMIKIVSYFVAENYLGILSLFISIKLSVRHILV